MIIMVDTETTGLEPSTSRIWQVGVLLVSEKWVRIDGMQVTMLDEEIESQLEERREVLPNLPSLDSIKQDSITPEKAWQTLSDFIVSQAVKPNYALAYNAKFDQKFVLEESLKFGYSLLPGINYLNQLKWLCAMEDVEQNYKFKCWKLGHLALDHGLTVNPSVLHGAFADISLTRDMLEKIGVTATDILNFNEEPWVILRAITIEPWKDNGVTTQIAKDLGYRWEKTPARPEKVFGKSWVKAVKRRHVEAEFKKADGKLPVREIKE